MFKHNLIDIFRSFSAHDIKRFEQFLRSPYFNGSEKMLSLYKAIIRYYPHFADIEFTKENLSINTSVSGRYNESTLRDALSELLKLTLKYLSISSFEKNSFDEENYLLEELLNRNIDKIFQRKVKNNSHFTKPIDTRYLYNRYWYETLLFNHDVTNKKVLHKKDAVERINELTHSSFSLFKFYITEAIALQLNSKVFANKYNIDYSKNPLNVIIKAIELDKFIKLYKNEDLAIIHMYKLLLAAFDGFDNEEYYFLYKVYVENHEHLLSPDEAAFHYNWLINYCIMKKKSSNRISNFDEELFELYNIYLKKKYYSDRKNKYLQIDLYRDIMIHGLYLRHFAWVRDFIRTYSSEVNPSERENIINYSYTYYYCNTGDYLKALDFYNKIIINNFTYKYDIKNLVLKMYYELNYLEEAICEIKSFKEFLRNNTLVPQERRTRNGKYLKYFEKLILLQIQDNKVEIEMLKIKLAKENDLSYKDWLLEKINKL